MLKTVFAAGAIAAMSASVAYAGDIPATPMNHGPLVVSGMGPVGDVVNLGLTPVNVVTQPILAPAGAPMAEPMAAPMKRHRRHHHMMKKHM